MSKFHSALIPAKVSYNVFWHRYFFSLHGLKLAEDKRLALVARIGADDGVDDDDFDDWDDDGGGEDGVAAAVAGSAVDDASSVDGGGDRGDRGALQVEAGDTDVVAVPEGASSTEPAPAESHAVAATAAAAAHRTQAEETTDDENSAISPAGTDAEAQSGTSSASAVFLSMSATDTDASELISAPWKLVDDAAGAGEGGRTAGAADAVVATTPPATDSSPAMADESPLPTVESAGDAAAATTPTLVGSAVSPAQDAAPTPSDAAEKIQNGEGEENWDDWE